MFWIFIDSRRLYPIPVRARLPYIPLILHQQAKESIESPIHADITRS